MKPSGQTAAMLLVASCFAPYVYRGIGLRLEHVLLYLSLPVAVGLLCLRSVRTSLNQHITLLIAVLFGAAAGWTLLVTLSIRGSVDARALASMDNFVQVVALLITSTAFLRFADPDEAEILATAVSRLLLWLLFTNACVAAASVFLDLSTALSPWRGGYESPEVSVASKAASMGRYSGIFDQPFESGVAYTLGLFIWSYDASRTQVISTSRWVLLMGLVVGGILSVSKTFIVLGAPLAVVYLITGPARSARLLMRFMIAAPAIGLGLLQFAQDWRGFDYFKRLFVVFSGADDVNLVARYTGGRFGSDDTTVLRMFREVMNTAPLEGFGYGSAAILDNAYLEFTYQGGLVALGCYVAALFTIAIIALRGWARGIESGRTLAFVTLFVAVAGLGAPVLTLNRVSVLLWIYIVLWLVQSAGMGRTSRSNQTMVATAPFAPKAFGISSASAVPSR